MNKSEQQKHSLKLIKGIPREEVDALKKKYAPMKVVGPTYNEYLHAIGGNPIRTSWFKRLMNSLNLFKVR